MEKQRTVQKRAKRPSQAQDNKAAGSKCGRGGAVKSRTNNRAGHRDRLTLVRSLIDTWVKDLKENTRKTGVAELARLLALEKELADSTETVREIKVTWVEPSPAASSK